jgi:hypothetical protein
VKDGLWITTEFVPLNQRFRTHVDTQSGSRYSLGKPATSAQVQVAEQKYSENKQKQNT